MRFLSLLFGSGQRLAYNLLALATLVPLVVWGRVLDTAMVFNWPLVAWPVRFPLVLLALWLIWGGARVFDLGDFSGLKQLALRERTERAQGGRLVMEGVLGRVRHPWYAAGLILLWVRNQDVADLITSLILSVYLVLGAVIEERRLIRSFGDNYRDYRRRVPMFFPRLRVIR